MKNFELFLNQEIKIGKNLTAICGMNGTQKTTLLGMLGQPFSITNGPLFGKTTIDGYNFRSQFSEKFKLSKKFDRAKQHKWTLEFFNKNIYNNKNCITIVSAERKSKSKKTSIRFINSEGKIKGKGYAQIPVIYLSLSRLFPIGESGKSNKIINNLNDEEIKLYLKLYRKILSIHKRDGAVPEISKKSKKYVFAGVSDSIHDLECNSAGESNVGRILLALLSFKRLKEECSSYKSGILLIDELDATLFGFAQKKIIDVLSEYSEKYSIQTIFTTHSPLLLRAVRKLQSVELFKLKSDVSMNQYCYKNEIVFLKNEMTNDKINIAAMNIHSAKDFKEKLYQMDLEIAPREKLLKVYFEDERAKDFMTELFNIMGISLDKYVEMQSIDLSCQHYRILHEHKVPEFLNNLIVLDNDVNIEDDKKLVSEYFKTAENVVYLPITVEKDLFRFLKNRIIFSKFEKVLEKKGIKNFDYQVCFSEWTEDDYKSEEFKKWFKKMESGINDLHLIYNFWYKNNEDVANKFKDDFISKYNILAQKFDYDLIQLNCS